MKYAIRTVMASALLVTTTALPVLAETGEAAADAATQKKVTAMMAADGYDVRKIVVEGENTEVYALKDGKQYVIYLDQGMKVVKTVKN